MARHRSSAAPLGWVWVALIVYASLFPFEGWRWPAGTEPLTLLRLPWPRYFIPFDIVSNLLGYAPLGFLVALARLRAGGGAFAALGRAVLTGMALSYGMELAQHALPSRVPSALDWLVNSIGALAGALLALVSRAWGVLARWDAMRNRWLDQGHGGALALLLLWPVALLFPGPVLLGLGQVGPQLTQWAIGWLDGVPWAQPLADWLASQSDNTSPLPPLANFLAVVLGLLCPCLLAYTASRRGARRVWMVLGAALLGLGATTLSVALSVGPEHALAWRTPEHLAALCVALLLALALAWSGPRVAAGLAMMALTGLVVLVHLAPTDPYLAQNLQSWEQGRFIRFHGLAQWIGWLWPYAAIAWVLGRLARV